MSENTAKTTQNQLKYRPLAFFLKDLSFENPKAPQIFQAEASQPKIQLNVEIAVQKLQNTSFEVAVKAHARADAGTESLFLAEVLYAGIFAINPEITDKNEIEHLLLVDCAKDVFPFIRQRIAETTRDGGFAPLIIDPVDFEQLYQGRMTK